MSDYYFTKNELAHHGILGQKWGVRRFQNRDGSYTAEGKARRNGDVSSSTIKIGNKEIKKSTIKKVAVGAAAIGTVTAAALYVKSHPQAIAKVVAKASKVAVKSLSKMNVNKGKEIVKKALKTAAIQAVQGAKDGLRDAPYKVVKAAVGGAAIIAANKLVEKAIGEEKNSAYIQAYNAYNKKNKIGAMPGSRNREDDD